MARKILLADDSVTAQNMGRRILSDAGYEVTTVNNGSAALKKIAESKPDLIVLDVYMPGYGGLEVCQRIREAAETARIPVLLTVGKLEPFKPEEVRRVRADAFIVKPFEASELLTALTKLEDRIVPPPQPHKPSRTAKPMAARDLGPDPAREFGDAETGWKNRLQIPRQPKSFEEEAEYDEGMKTSEAALAMAQDMPPGLPRDITPDEIAAIRAAAAAFGTRVADSFVPPEPVPESPTTATENPYLKPLETSAPSVSPDLGEIPASFASVPEAKVESDSAPLVEPEPPAPEAKAEAVAEVQPEQAVVTEEMTSAAPSSEVSEQPGKLADHEVADVLASLMQSNADADARAAETEPVAIAAAAAVTGEKFSGPRWTAEAIAVTSEESALILEQEMEKALAAMAAADAEQTSPVVEAAESVAYSAPASPVAESPETPQAASWLPTPTEIEAVVADAVALQAESAPADVPAPQAKEEAYAAAASAGSAEAMMAPAAPAEVPQMAPPSSESAPPERESDLAAAWASWKQIRESVVSPETTAPVADEANAGFRDIRREEPVPDAEPQPEAAAGAPAEGEEAIANIVDSVLAELKPKLMEQIAKKIGKEKRKK